MQKENFQGLFLNLVLWVSVDSVYVQGGNSVSIVWGDLSGVMFRGFTDFDNRKVRDVDNARNLILSNLERKPVSCCSVGIFFFIYPWRFMYVKVCKLVA